MTEIKVDSRLFILFRPLRPRTYNIIYRILMGRSLGAQHSETPEARLHEDAAHGQRPLQRAFVPRRKARCQDEAHAER